MTKPKGWRREPARHSLAARGIKSASKQRKARHTAIDIKTEKEMEEWVDEQKEYQEGLTPEQSYRNKRAAGFFPGDTERYKLRTRLKKLADKDLSSDRAADFAEFFYERFPEHAHDNYIEENYAKNWIRRFRDDEEWVYADLEAQRVLKKVNPVKYEKKQKESQLKGFALLKKETKDDIKRFQKMKKEGQTIVGGVGGPITIKFDKNKIRTINKHIRQAKKDLKEIEAMEAKLKNG